MNGICRAIAGLHVMLLASLSAIAAPTPTDSISQKDSESIFPNISRVLYNSHFTWGADVGASIDMDVEDMSTFNADMYFGYKSKFVKFAGIGAGVHRSFGKGNNFIPVYAMFRSSFRNKPSLVFLDIRGGYSFNSIAGSDTHRGFYGGLGIGFNLSRSNRFNTHIILSYAALVPDKEKQKESENTYTGKFINYAELKFGISF